MTTQNVCRLRILAPQSKDVATALRMADADDDAYSVTSVRDGVTAMHTLLGETSFDLAIIDLALASLDGLRLIALIRATPELRRLPVLAIASPHNPDSTIESLRAGANDYLARPFEWPLLVMRIRQLTAERVAPR